MFEVGEFVVNKRNVCQIENIKDNRYVLVPIDDSSLKIEIPIDSKFGGIRRLISKSRVEEIIQEIPKIETLCDVSEKILEAEYKKLLNTGLHSNLIKIIKTTYLRNEKRINENKKISEKDDTYFKMAEKLLYNEFSIVLGLSVDETKSYVIKEVEKI